MIFYYPDSCNGDENNKHMFRIGEAGISRCFNCGMYYSQYTWEKEKIEMERWQEKKRKREQKISS